MQHATFEFCFNYKGGLKPSGQVWAGLTGKLVVKYDYQLYQNSPPSWSRLGAQVKNILGQVHFSGGGCLSLEFSVENWVQRG